MKIIIAYAPVGSGHFKAAKAIYNYFKEKKINIELRLVDILKDSNPFFRFIYINGYNFLVRHALWLWTSAFYITSLKALRPFVAFFHSGINRLNTKNIARTIIRDNPAFVISTHFLPSGIISHLKEAGKINSKLITVITDFGVHPFWLCRNTDLYIAASGLTKKELILEGVPEANIRESGIPVDPVFLVDYERETLSKKLGIESAEFTVLIVTGSFGIGPIKEIVSLLCGNAQLLVVCANNNKLYRQLKNKEYPRVKVFGFIDNMDELMAVSDMIITKPGGSSISEALARELAPLFISVIPGQEAENARVLEKYGIGMMASGPEQIREIVLDFKNHPDKIIKIKENIRKMKKPYALEELYDVVCKNSLWAAG